MTASKNEYTAEFKEEAVRLVISSQKSCAKIAFLARTAPVLVRAARLATLDRMRKLRRRNLGIPPYLVVRWQQQHEQRGAAGRSQFTGRGVAALSEQEARFKKLERELEITRQERDILRKALAVLARTAPVLGRTDPQQRPSVASDLASSWAPPRSRSGAVLVKRRPARMRTLARFFAKEN